MFLMMAEVLRLHEVAESAVSGLGVFAPPAARRVDVGWRCSLHDLIQPSFSFLVGVALPFSIANRRARGQSKAAMTAHAFWRSLSWSCWVSSSGRGMGRKPNSPSRTPSPRSGWGKVPVRARVLLDPRAMDRTRGNPGGILGGLRAVSRPGSEFDFTKVGVPATWPHHPLGFAAHWDKNSNLAWAVDTWFLNLFPRERPFTTTAVVTRL